ncbi:GPR1/FUN34/yaaH family-domain-containing protein [Sparassis latifolia]
MAALLMSAPAIKPSPPHPRCVPAPPPPLLSLLLLLSATARPLSHSLPVLQNPESMSSSMSQLEKAEVNALPPQPARPAFTPVNAQFRKFGNPGPLGLFAFSTTTLMLSLFNVSARDIHIPNVIVGMTLWVGGLSQLLAGMWEFASANTFGATGQCPFPLARVVPCSPPARASNCPPCRSVMGFALPRVAAALFPHGPSPRFSPSPRIILHAPASSRASPPFAFSLFGTFWMSYGTIYIPSSGILAAYAAAPDQLASGLGIYLFMFFIISVILTIASTRRSYGLIALFFNLSLTFLLLGVAELVASTAKHTVKGGGAFGIITAAIGFYIGTAQLLNREESWFTLPTGPIAPRLD